MTLIDALEFCLIGLAFIAALLVVEWVSRRLPRRENDLIKRIRDEADK
jgi:hypothetical protein